jgi:hypothetical protein
VGNGPSEPMSEPREIGSAGPQTWLADGLFSFSLPRTVDN